MLGRMKIIIKNNQKRKKMEKSKPEIAKEVEDY